MLRKVRSCAASTLSSPSVINLLAPSSIVWSLLAILCRSFKEKPALFAAVANCLYSLLWFPRPSAISVHYICNIGPECIDGVAIGRPLGVRAVGENDEDDAAFDIADAACAGEAGFSERVLPLPPPPPGPRRAPPTTRRS